MKTICITSTVSGAGKTSLAEKIIKSSDGWAACKVTVYNDNTDQVKGFSIEDSPEVIGMAGTDTCRLMKAGAGKVLWVRTERGHVKKAVSEALEKLDGYERAIFEGNSALKVFKPDLAVMIRSEGALKDSARDVMDMIDVFIDGFPGENAVRKVIDRFDSA